MAKRRESWWSLLRIGHVLVEWDDETNEVTNTFFLEGRRGVGFDSEQRLAWEMWSRIPVGAVRVRPSFDFGSFKSLQPEDILEPYSGLPYPSRLRWELYTGPEIPSTDTEYEEHMVAEVCDDGDWVITREDGWQLRVSKETGVEPHVGEKARFYGGGVGLRVRGLVLNERIVFYETPKATTNG